jgi:hypothetical protein
MAGNRGVDYFSWLPKIGAYRLTAIPYSEDRGMGIEGESSTISFQVIDSRVKVQSIIISPNPIGDGPIQVRLAQAINGNVSLKLVNEAGDLIGQETLAFNDKVSTFTSQIDTRHLQNRVYHLIIAGDNIKPTSINVLK